MPGARVGGTDRVGDTDDVFDMRPTLEELREPIRFRFCVFLYELFIHQCMPLSIPVVVLLEGLQGLHTRDFLYLSKMMIMAHCNSVFIMAAAFFYISGNSSSLNIDIWTVAGEASAVSVSLVPVVFACFTERSLALPGTVAA